MPVEEYDPVRLNEQSERDGRVSEGKMAGTVADTLLAILSTVLYLLDVASSICYAAFLFSYANNRLVEMYGFPYDTWGALIIVVTVVSGFIINILATFDRYEFRNMDWMEILFRALLCFVPHFYIIGACCTHLVGMLQGRVSDRKLEWVIVLRMLQGLGEGVPQVILQGYTVTREVLRRGKTETAYPTWVPVTSLSFSIVNAAFALAFYLVSKYYSESGTIPRWWQQSIVAVTALLLLGGRALAVGTMGAAWDMLWVAVLGLVTIFLLVLVYWTYRVRKRAGAPFHALKTRISLSLIETLTIAVPLRWTAIVSLPYLGLSAAFVGQRHEDAIDWVLFSVPLAAQLLGLLLVLACRQVYWTAYQGLMHSVLPPKQEVVYPIVS